MVTRRLGSCPAPMPLSKSLRFCVLLCKAGLVRPSLLNGGQEESGRSPARSLSPKDLRSRPPSNLPHSCMDLPAPPAASEARGAGRLAEWWEHPVHSHGPGGLARAFKGRTVPAAVACRLLAAVVGGPAGPSVRVYSRRGDVCPPPQSTASHGTIHSRCSRAER